MTVRYKVWPFRKFHSCYDCGSVERIDAVPVMDGFELTGEEFVALERSIHAQGPVSDIVYLYHVVGANADEQCDATLRAHVENGLALIAQQHSREQRKAEKLKEKKLKEEEAARKAAETQAEKERQDYERLRAKFEKEKS